jgi:predicted  nucleic acid-binding Zn-ribbon protein
MENQQNNEGKRKVSAVIIAALVLLLGLTGYFSWQNWNLQKQLKQCFDSSAIDAKEASAKNDSLTMDFTSLSGRYDSLSTVYTDLDSLFKTEKERLTKLEEDLKKYNSGATGGMSYASIKKEYVILKARQEDYLKQIDLLKEENRKLTLENIDVKTDLQVEKDNNEALNKKVDNLTSKIQTDLYLALLLLKPTPYR